jgi:bifunctional DNA-binding transcriptional regulator/antitoxin component of YhaV-PrlF toxin-antitoxin module
MLIATAFTSGTAAFRIAWSQVIFRRESPRSSAARASLSGRIAVPARYRERLHAEAGGRVVVTVDSVRCLLMYPLPEWEVVERKLAAIGVRVRRGVTTHGLALNVNTDLRWFAEMIPCGIRGKTVTSLSAELGRRLDSDAVADRLALELARAFGLRLAEGRSGVIGPAGASEQ